MTEMETKTVPQEQAGGYPGGQQPPPQGYTGYPAPAGGQPGYPAPPGGQPMGPPGQPIQYTQPGQQPYYPQGQPGYGPPPQGQPGYGAPPQGYAMAQPYGGPPGAMQPGQPGQPGQIVYMARPEPIPGCPPGLEYLTQIDQLLVHQQVEMFEAFTNFETQNRYQIKNTQGQQVYFAGEESDTCHRQCCGPQRGFVMHITDNMGQEVIRVNREFKCCAGMNCCAGCECCAMEVTIEAPPGQVVGSVKQQMSCLAPKYHIVDASDQTILEIEGPVCICQGPCCTADQEFKVIGMNGEEVGKISKQWSGFVKEYFTQADNFGVSFPMDLDVKMKAVMIGAVFLIDFMFFEQKQNNNN